MRLPPNRPTLNEPGTNLSPSYVLDAIRHTGDDAALEYPDVGQFAVQDDIELAVDAAALGDVHRGASCFDEPVDIGIDELTAVKAGDNARGISRGLGGMEEGEYIWVKSESPANERQVIVATAKAVEHDRPFDDLNH